MRIGIIGGGAAGLTCAWLLEAQHEVTLFEKEGRLGGHAHTLDIEAQGGHYPVDAGFEFFSAGEIYGTFNRLLDILGVPRQSYAATLTVFQPGDGAQHPVAMPPFREWKLLWPSLTPEALRTLIYFRQFLIDARAFLEQHETTVTIADYIAQGNFPKPFVTHFLYPMLASFWGAELADFTRYAAYNAVYYLGANFTQGMRPPEQMEINGGMRVYIGALVNALAQTQLRPGATITRIAYTDGVYTINAAGEQFTFDHLILATDAQNALRMLPDGVQFESRREQLGRFEYSPTTIAIHGDRRLMPRQEALWSVVNVRWDGAHSALSMWKPTRGVPIFKSWVTFDPHLPEPLYALVKYDHVKVTLDYFDAQRKLKTLQGQQNLWLAGQYTYDVDSHESAIRSAVAITEKLAPDSLRLKSLREH